MNPIAVTAIQAMVAPVVLITTGAILSGALLTMYGSVNDRMRAMDRERLDILTGTAGALLSAAEVPPAGRERLTQLDTQLPMLLRRHRLLHNAVLLIYADYLRRRGCAGARRDRHWGRRDGQLRGCGDRRSGPGSGRHRDASRRALVRCAIDHDLHGRDRLRSAARPVTRVIIVAGHCVAAPTGM